MIARLGDGASLFVHEVDDGFLPIVLHSCGPGARFVSKVAA